MGKAVVRAALWLLLPVSLLAQNNADQFSTPKGELFAGYSYVRIEGNNMHGWNVAASGNVNDNLAIVADASGNYASDKLTVGSAVTTSNLNFFTFMAGPRVMDRSMRTFTPFAHALVGMTRINADLTVTQPTLPTSERSNDTTGFAAALGGGLDLNVSQGMAIRIIQADYFLIRSDNFKHEGARLGFGFVARFGQRSR